MTRNRLSSPRRAALSSGLATLLMAAVCAGTTGLQAGSAAAAPGNGGAAGVAAPDALQPARDTEPAATGHVTTIDQSTHQLRATVDGKTVAVFPAGFGMARFPTRSGTYHVLGKDPMVEMTSCSARITCDSGSPDYYDLQVPDAVRLTSGGLFVHAAPWDHSVGSVDTSHGCIHLNPADAKWFYDFSQVGDTVIVEGTGRGGGPVGP
ncbi:L,D-transpeptidase [Streptomyces sp. NPDC092296]|uniref:L,D-transpeptidase n=1 Tax=Streptomyces sp. NPDC092296 TaxID=3366012 RepID=UPI003810465B